MIGYAVQRWPVTDRTRVSSVGVSSCCRRVAASGYLWAQPWTGLPAAITTHPRSRTM